MIGTIREAGDAAPGDADFAPAAVSRITLPDELDPGVDPI